MKDDKKLDLLLERFYNRYNKYNTKVLETLGKAIKKFDGITPSQAHKIAQQLKYGTDIDDLASELAKITNRSIEDIYKAFDIVAKENIEFAEVYARAKNKEIDKDQLDKLVNAISKETVKEFVNISNSKMIGFSLIDQAMGKKVFKPLKKAYNDLIDEAVFNITTGTTDYQSAMRDVMKQLADSGVKKVDYKSGYSRRLDSTVRQDILTGVRQLNIDIQEQVGKEFGADGVETSAHSPCAFDHLPIQGQQFSKKEFERLNSNLTRPIGELNCRHFIFSIVLGVNKPSYTKKQLQQLNKDSTRIVKYEGKKYTSYEATQVQRKLETAIRQQKDRQIIARASGDKEGIAQAQSKISQLTSKYNDFSRNAKLDTYKNRLAVSGYRRVSIK